MSEFFQSEKFIESVIVIALTVLIIAILKFIQNKLLRKKTKDSAFSQSVKVAVDLIIFIIVIFCILSLMSIRGINVMKYFASLGIASVIIGFAAQDLLKDIIMGISILFENYYKLGDIVSHNGREGKVIYFNLKTTKIKYLDNEAVVSIPNRNINDVEICSDWFDLDIPIGYDVDLYYARSICQECAQRIERLRYVYSCDFINTQSFESSYVIYRVRVHCMIEKHFPLRRACNGVVQNVFYEHDLGFPYSSLVLFDDDYHKPLIGKDIVREVYGDDLEKFQNVFAVGKGAKYSTHITLNGSDESVQEAIKEAGRYAKSEALNKSMCNRIELLTEELLSLTGKFNTSDSATFYVQRTGSNYELCYNANTKLNIRDCRSILALSTSGKNEGLGPLGNMISKAVYAMLDMQVNNNSSQPNAGESDNLFTKSISRSGEDYRWSLSIFDETSSNTATEYLDPLAEDNIERKILSGFAEDIHVAIVNNKLSITVLVKNTDKTEN